jgi:ABC-type dipeptide/oligopeptide/nickel transport system permease component
MQEQEIELQINRLREIFHFDDPAWQRYCRWMGFNWFLTFKDADQGLLQGHMGYSMETLRPVNQLVGDRIWLTMLVSFLTIVMTWAIAVPVGIYTAVKQYSLMDYILTLVAFLGMCVPGFLLVLVLMAWTGIDGLFSAEYAMQPYWDMGKVLDMLSHIWLPVLVTGVGGSAGMIRVMRANLLDELRKPYVITARAKGVRPGKLLFKYPVRLALNPFISGIGGLFPALISGSSIIAIVMSLPTVGPLMLAALFNQDMYMAGSMLMVLSSLAVFGTLVSDLLLMVVDPRIRIGGK